MLNIPVVHNDNRSLATLEKDVDSMINTNGTVFTGYLVVAGFLAVLFFWAAAAPMPTASIAPGVVGVTGLKKSIQHLEGGIVSQLHVTNGDTVNAGDTLLTLFPVSTKAEYEDLKLQLMHAEVELERWQAEYDGSPKIEYPAQLVEAYPADLLLAAVDSQESVFEARNINREQALIGIEKEIEQEQQKQQGANIKLKTLATRKKLLQAELADYKSMNAEGLVTRNQLFALERQSNDILLAYQEAQSAIKLTDSALSLLESEKTKLLSSATQESAENMSRLQTMIDSLQPKLTSLEDQISRLEIKSPIDGQVINLAVHTAGAVIASGQVILEIVPEGENLLIESQLSPRDRDSVRIGQDAKVRFSAFDRRSTPPFKGKVKVIAADSTIDPISLQAHYKTIVDISLDDNKAIDLKLFPGMQAEVIIVTGKQTMLSYLTAPITRSFNRALIEE